MSIRESLLIPFTSASVESVIDKNSSSSAGGVLGGVTKASSVKWGRKKSVKLTYNHGLSLALVQPTLPWTLMSSMHKGITSFKRN